MAASTVFRRALGIVRRGLWVVVLVGVVLLVLWFRVWSPVSVEVARIDRGTITQEAFGRGTIESSETPPRTPRVRTGRPECRSG